MAMRMKDSGIEWIGEIPEDWEVRKLKYISSSMGGGTPSKDRAEFWNGDIPWVSPKDMKNEIISTAEDMITVEGLEQSSTKMVLQGAVLIVVRSGILKHTIPVAINAVNVAMNQDMKAVMVDPAVMTNAFFLRWIQGLNDALLKEWVKLSATVDSIEQEYFANTCIAYPSIKAQEIIIRFLDSRCAEIDTVIAAKQRQNELLKEQRQSIIFEAVTKGLDPMVTYKDSGVEWIGEMPEGWEAFKIKHIVAVPVTDGPHESPQLVDEGIPFISAEAVKGNKLDFSLMRGYISKEDHEVYCKKVRPQREDIFVVKSGATTGAIAIVDTDDEFSIWSPLALVRSKKPDYIQRFVYYAMLSDSFRKQIELGWNFGTQQNLGMNVLENLYIACPLSTEVQQQISDYLDTRCAELDRVVAANNAVIDKLKEYRQSLIYEAVTGKIAV